MKTETEKMRELYDQWQTQGVSKQAFCKQNGMGYHKFNYWVKKFHPNNFSPAVPTRGFSRIPVEEPEVTEQNQHLLAAITFPSGARIELFGSLDAALIKKLII
ncbi:IS66 family insertion sequence element accessory protein TnpA [Dyadobacter sp. 32]|uniref:IS66 family insertion sequence element accessory protein TnpA n=1 Tax=Dyadobacter sp. 32 TaxID=538966 RepID=UPI0011ED613B